jgi:hypothetical protein
MTYTDMYPTRESMMIAIRIHLINLARNLSHTTYGKLVRDLNLPIDMKITNQRNELNKMLGDISVEEISKRRVPLSILVWNQGLMMPGDGFFEYMALNGEAVDPTNEDSKYAYFARKQQEIHRYWNRH